MFLLISDEILVLIDQLISVTACIVKGLVILGHYGRFYLLTYLL